MSFLSEPIYDTVIFQGCRYRVNVSFDIVLDVQRLYREKDLTDLDKLDTALDMFCARKARRLSVYEKVALLELIFNEQVKTKSRPKVGKQIKVVDFEEDGEYIYASFLQDYGIDLIDCQGKLHWKKFIALFQGLSDSTKIKQIMQIRGRELPAPTKYNQDEIRNLMELKAYYSLNYCENSGKKGLELLFATLEGAAQ